MDDESGTTVDWGQPSAVDELFWYLHAFQDFLNPAPFVQEPYHFMVDVTQHLCRIEAYFSNPLATEKPPVTRNHKVRVLASHSLQGLGPLQFVPLNPEGVAYIRAYAGDHIADNGSLYGIATPVTL